MIKVAIAIDLQNDFVVGSLGNKENEKACMNASDFLSKLKDHYFVATLDTHNKETYLDTIEGKNIPVFHTIKGESGHKLHESIEPYFTLFGEPENVTIEKETYGAIDIGTIIKTLLNGKNEKEVEFVMFGLLTDYCVISNYCILHSTFPNTKIYVISDCSMGVTNESHEAALSIMKGLDAIVSTKNEYLKKENKGE